MSLKTRPFDASEYLDSPDAIQEYLNAAFEDGDPDLILAAIGDVAKAKGMTDIAKQAGVTRASLYKSLTAGAKPQFQTILKVIQSFGVKMAVQG